MSIEAMKLARQLLWRYRHETPIGNQPYMICQEVDEAFEKIDQAIEQAQHQLKPRCFADFQPNHEIDRKCQWCAVETECKTGIPAIEQAKQEPVAWRHDMGEENGGWEYFEEASCPDCQPLYTSPPQQSTIVRQSLTDEQIKVLQDANWKPAEDGGKDWNTFDFARAIEAAHKIGVEK